MEDPSNLGGFHIVQRNDSNRNNDRTTRIDSRHSVQQVESTTVVDEMSNAGFVLFDAQMNNPHLERFGSFIIDEGDYDKLLQRAIAQNCTLALP